MTTLLKIQTSLFGNAGQSSRLADQFVARWQARHPQGRVVVRDLAADPVPHLDFERFEAFTTPADKRTARQQAIADCSDALIAELASADVVVLGVPMYNFSVPSTLRAYFDHIARAGITFRYTSEGPEGLLQGKQAFVFLTRGGIHGETHSQDAFLRQFLGFVGITDVAFIHAEGLAMGEDASKEGLRIAESKLAQLDVLSPTARAALPRAHAASLH